VLVVVFWGLLQLDLPLARFLRSVQLPWLELAGDVGSRLGSGAILAVISGALLAIGLARKQAAFRRAGVGSLIAHAAAALSVQALKHLIGRPRPRMTHGGGFQFGPSWDVGLDSFPSGHTAASFAVAAVLAKQFPRARWLIYGVATFVAVSRVMRGSHFPTDVIAGVGLGLLAGYVVANPIRAWRSSLATALTDLAPYLVGAFALLWTALHTYPDELTDSIMVAVGVVGMAIGVGTRLYRTGKGREDSGLSGSSGFSGSTKQTKQTRQTQLLASHLLIAVGLALTTGSLLVTALAVLVSSAQWLAQPRPDSLPASTQPRFLDFKALAVEAAFALGLIAAVVAIQGLKGLLPLL
jgi:undecaprenyl-diphosphatase